ncbi:MAG TPA: hypothetical protein VK993_12330 [Chthoniobacterales bacterium]|nr:hypothetical protein [Chthoniobacterales bacterium]
MASRDQNERKFGAWEELPKGGRRYTRDYAGRAGGRARYIKEVDATETTTRFAQEIYDREGRLMPSTRSFPSIQATGMYKVAATSHEDHPPGDRR